MNIFKEFLLAKDQRSMKDFNFFRYIGFENEIEYKAEISSLKDNLKKLGVQYVLLENKINLPYNMELAEKVVNLLSEAENSFNVLTQTGQLFLTNGVIPVNLNMETKKRLETAINEIVKVFLQNELDINKSMFKNFLGKLMTWVNEYISNLDKKNSKIVYYGNIKKHEVYFLILMSKVGVDVLYLNPMSEMDYIKVDIRGEFSYKIKGTAKGDVSLFTLGSSSNVSTPNPVGNDMPNQCINSSVKLFDYAPDNTKHFSIVLGNGKDIIEDITTPLKDREEYSELQNIRPAYFYRYIGIDKEGEEGRDEYYNKIFQMDKKLSKSVGYICFNKPIPMPDIEEINKTANRIQSEFRIRQIDDIASIINRIANSTLLKLSNNELMNNTIKDSFKWIMSLFIKQEAGTNFSKIENFLMKLVVWIDKYYPKLFNSIEEAPKVMFYGDIKVQEAYFLLYLSRIGCDVLYINSDTSKDSIFKHIDRKNNLTLLVESNRSEALETFPIAERNVRKATVTFNASQQIQDILYTEDTKVGLYRPWQFENYKTTTVTLKTTYDELKILWNEHAKIRPEFKIENGRVYIPTIFAKVNGVTEDIFEYWKDFQELSHANNVCTITKVPFTNDNYSREDMYASAYLFNKAGLIDTEKLKESNIYKFKYLRLPLQNLILNKINELINSNSFKIPMDGKFRLKILMTIMNMNDEILKLLEKFDYPCDIPKLLIYNNSRIMFSDEDIITISFLNLIGVDIVILTPTSYSNIELVVKDSLFDIHKFPKVEFDLQIPNKIEPQKKSIFSKIFGL